MAIGTGEGSYIIYGVDASYFTQKALAYFAYKGIPFEYRKKTLMVKDEVEEKSGSHMIPVVVTPAGEYIWDTTPIMLGLEEKFTAGGILPATPRQRIVARLLEDYLDEWIPRIVIHLRWFNDADAETSGGAIVRDLLGVTAEAELDAQQQAVFDQAFTQLRNWGLATCEKVGSGKDDAAQVEEELGRFFVCLEAHLRDSKFLLGDKPSLPDFTLMGALQAHFLFDPTPRALVGQIAPSLVRYHGDMAAARAKDVESDGAGEWPSGDEIPVSLTPLLQQIGNSFMRFLPLNTAALAAGEKELSIDLGGGERIISTRRYTEKCRAQIAGEIAALDGDARASVEAVLAPAGCWDAYQG
jgi:glutathione S-transferase